MGTRTAILLAFSSFALLRADDLMTRDGKLYSDYKIILHDSRSITISYSDGAANIPISNLPADLQQKYGGQAAVSDPAPSNAPPPGGSDASTPPAPANDPSAAPVSQSNATANSNVWTVNGITYSGVVVMGSNDYQVQIASGGKIVTLLLKDLSPDLQTQFHYDSNKAKAAELKEKNTHHGMDEVGGL